MSERYRLSFTTGGLFLREASTVVERYLSIRDWKAARDQVRQENLLQVRTAAAATRISKEVTARLELLDEAELSFACELDELAASTQQKLRQNLFRMLREADLISEQHVIKAALLSPHVVELLARRGMNDLMVFPVSDSEIQRWLA